MTTGEKLSVFIFVAVIITVYAAEILLGLVWAVSKVGGIAVAVRFSSKPILLLHLLAIIGLVCLVYGYFIEPYWVQISHVEVETEKLSLASFRIVQLSDLQCSKKAVNEAKLARLIDNLEPDIIVFTGDCLNEAAGLSRFKDTMKGLKAPIGKYAVTGNIDVWRFRNVDLFGDTGFEVLENQSVKLQKNGETLYISGVGGLNSIEHNKELAAVPKQCYSVLLHHYPDLIEDLGNSNVDLYLAGHTHGGQVALPFYGAIITFSKHGKKYESGKYSVGGTILYVNRGLGLEGGIAPRVRFLARPEIAVFDIRGKSHL